MSEEFLREILGELKSMNNRIDNLETTMGSRIDNLETTMGNRIDTLETTMSNRIDTLDGAVGNLQSGQQALQNDIKELQVGQQGMNNRLNKLEIRIENEVIDKIRALFDARSVQEDVNNRIFSTLERIETKIDVIQLETAHVRRAN